MGQGLLISAAKQHVGKNMLALCMALHLQKEGINVGYMKPIGITPVRKNDLCYDETAFFAKDVLGVPEDIRKITPILMTSDLRTRLLQGQEEDPFPVVSQAYTELAAQHDLMLVAGSGSVLSYKHCGLDSVRLVKELGLKIIIADRPDPDFNYDLLVSCKEIFADALLGIVFNDVSPEFMPEVNNIARPFFARHGINVLGVLPKTPLLGAVRAHELVEHLDGKQLTAEGLADGIVEKVLIGTMQVENFITYFRRHPHSAVLVGGDRADVQLVAIEGGCPCLVLTGNLLPNEIIVSRAEKLHIPIIMVKEHTYAVACKMENILALQKMNDIAKVSRGSKLVDDNIDFAAIRSAFKI